MGPRDWCPDEKGKLGQSPRGAALTEKVAEARWRQAWPWRGLREPGSAGDGPKLGDTARESSLSLQSLRDLDF